METILLPITIARHWEGKMGRRRRARVLKTQQSLHWEHADATAGLTPSQEGDLLSALAELLAEAARAGDETDEQTHE